MFCNNKGKKNNQQDGNASPDPGGQEQKITVLFDPVHAYKRPKIEAIDGCKGIGAKGRGVLCNYLGQTKGNRKHHHSCNHTDSTSEMTEKFFP